MAHSVLHDAESLFYALIWITFTQAGPDGQKRCTKASEDDWSVLCPRRLVGASLEAALQNLSYAKAGVMYIEREFQEQIIGRSDPYFCPLKRCLITMRKVLFPLDKSSDTSSSETSTDSEEEEKYDRPRAFVDRRRKEEVFRKIEQALVRAIIRRSKKEGIEFSPELKIPKLLSETHISITGVGTSQTESGSAIDFIPSRKLLDAGTNPSE